jgi:hypothetical protein
VSDCATRRTRTAAVAIGAALVVTLATGCATQVDPDLAAPATGPAPATTAFVATGSTTELLDQLLVEAGGLSEAIVQNEGQRDVIARIDAIWEAARPGVEEAAPDEVLELDRAIVMLHTGVDRRRPADADKAYTNLVNLLAALPAPAQ